MFRISANSVLYLLGSDDSGRLVQGGCYVDDSGGIRRCTHRAWPPVEVSLAQRKVHHDESQRSSGCAIMTIARRQPTDEETFDNPRRALPAGQCIPALEGPDNGSPVVLVIKGEPSLHSPRSRYEAVVGAAEKHAILRDAQGAIPHLRRASPKSAESPDNRKGPSGGRGRVRYTICELRTALMLAERMVAERLSK